MQNPQQSLKGRSLPLLCDSGVGSARVRSLGPTHSMDSCFQWDELQTAPVPPGQRGSWPGPGQVRA